MRSPHCPITPPSTTCYRTATGLFPGLARLGVTQLIYSSSHPELPAPAREQARADLSTAGQARSQRDEFAMVPTMMAQAGAVTDLGDRPLYVLTAPVDAQTGWLTTQMEPRRVVRQQHPPGRRRRHPRITARQSLRRCHDQPGDHRSCRRGPDRRSPAVNGTPAANLTQRMTTIPRISWSATRDWTSTCFAKQKLSPRISSDHPTGATRKGPPQ